MPPKVKSNPQDGASSSKKTRAVTTRTSRKTTKSRFGTFRLLDLPLELRCMIYEEFFRVKGSIVIASPLCGEKQHTLYGMLRPEIPNPEYDSLKPFGTVRRASSSSAMFAAPAKNPLALLLVCKQTCVEAHSYLYAKQHFIFLGDTDFSVFTCRFRKALPLLTHMTVIPECGSGRMQNMLFVVAKSFPRLKSFTMTISPPRNRRVRLKTLDWAMTCFCYDNYPQRSVDEICDLKELRALIEKICIRVHSSTPAVLDEHGKAIFFVSDELNRECREIFKTHISDRFAMSAASEVVARLSVSRPLELASLLQRAMRKAVPLLDQQRMDDLLADHSLGETPSRERLELFFEGVFDKV